MHGRHPDRVGINSGRRYEGNPTGLKTGHYIFSKMPAAPMPPPMHMVTMP
jgi:hypothetical protein